MARQTGHQRRFDMSSSRTAWRFGRDILCCNTPDRFPGHRPALAFGTPAATRRMFTSEGTFVDQDGDVLNGTVFLAVPNDRAQFAGDNNHGCHGADSPVAMERYESGWISMTTRITQALGEDEAGFSLIETLIAMAILATALLSLAGVFILGLSQLAGASSSLIAREKAREAVESVHTARDIRTLAWCEIRNRGAVTNCPNGNPRCVPVGPPSRSKPLAKMASSTPTMTKTSKSPSDLERTAFWAMPTISKRP